MEIKDEVQTVDMLFTGRSRQYKVPIYQRRYVWDEKNWNSLWTDITRMSDQHFTGIIVTRRHDDTGDLEKYDVIDGQQRLTTFQIILCVIRDVCLSKSHTSKADEADRLIKNEGRNVGDEERYKLLLKEGSDDESAFHALVESGPLGEHVIHRAYNHFERLIKDYDLKQIDKIYTNIILGVNVAQIDLVEGDTSEKIFASLNATGRMLNEFDYLRNDLFLRAGGCSESFYKSETHWHPSFEDDDTSDLDIFLRDFLKANLGPSCFQSNLKPFELYQQDYRNQFKLNIEEEFTRLSAFAQFNKDMNNPTSDVGRHMQFYEDLGISPLDSFILFIKHKAIQADIELSKVYQILESYIIRHLLCEGQCDYKSINEFFSEAIGDSYEFSVPRFAEFLSNTWPEKPMVEIAMQGAGHQIVSNANLIRYMLYRIELLNNPLLPFASLELEPKHIMPLKYKDTWGRSDWQDAKFADAPDSIGNITLVPPTDSIGWSELNFDEKKRVLKASIVKDLTLNKEIIRESNWNLTQIEERADRLLSDFGKIWPPASKF